jgi:hypothetical protein
LFFSKEKLPDGDNRAAFVSDLFEITADFGVAV